jgi:hypothetical protein
MNVTIPNDPSNVRGSLILDYVRRPATHWDATEIKVYPEGHWTLFTDPKTGRRINKPRLQNLRPTIPYFHQPIAEVHLGEPPPPRRPIVVSESFSTAGKQTLEKHPPGRTRSPRRFPNCDGKSQATTF